VAGYAETAPTPALAAVLTCVWTRTTEPGPAREHRIVPDGCLDLIWTGSGLLVAGPDTGPVLTTATPGTLVGVRFVPGTAPAVLGVPSAELRDQRPDLADLGVPGAALVDRLADADPAAAALVLQRAVADLLRPDLLDPAMPDVLAGLRAGEPVSALADRLGLTERALHRRSVAAFGYGPKFTQRVLRFQRAVGLARAGRPFGIVAADTGYADQAHLARDVCALAGIPLGELVRPTPPFSGRTPEA
jgi:AraC-like DNA-binding protein